MKDITKILVPFDFSKTSESALTYAINFIDKDDTIEIILVHVSESENFGEQKEKLEGKIKKINEEYPNFKGSLKWIVKTGNLIDAILNSQVENQVDLIIMGTRGVDQNEDKELTNTSKLVLEAECPVIAIPENARDFTIKKIALVLGKNEIDDASVLGTLLDIARRFKAQVNVLTICNNEENYGYTEADERNENMLGYYLEHFYSHHSFQENSDIEKGIFDYINANNIDLLTILPRNHAKKNSPSEGRLTKLLTLHTEVPLLTID